MRPSLTIPLALGALALSSIHAAPALAQHEHEDFAIGSDAMGGGNLLLDYPFDERPVVRVTDSGAPVGLFTAGDPGFDAVEEDEPLESVFTLPAGQGISLEVVAIDEIVSLKMDNGVDGTFFIPFDGDTYRIGLIGDGVCNQVTMLCTAGDVGAPCTENADCHTLTPSIHNHPEYQLLLLGDPEEFAEGRVTFKLTNTGVGATYGESPLYSLTFSNGHLPGLEIEENPAEADARASCQKTLAKAVRTLTGSQYKLLSKCLDRAIAAEHLGKSETAAIKACDVDDTDSKSLVGRLAAARQKTEDEIADSCGPLSTSSEPYTLSQVKTVNPGFDTADGDLPGQSLFALNPGTQVSFAVQAIAAGASVKFGATILAAAGESAVIGTSDLHVHPTWQVQAPVGVFGDWPVTFKLTPRRRVTPNPPTTP